MKKSKKIILVLVLLLIALGSVPLLIIASGHALISSFHLPIDWYFNLPFDMRHSEIKKFSSFAKAAVGASFVLPFLVFGGIGFAILMPKKRGLHGDARLATRDELVAGGLLVPDSASDKYPSVLVGKVDKDFLFFKGQQFLYLAAPTRSGKGVGIVIPNLLHYRDSCVCLDIKGENFDMTSGFRAKCGQKIFKFAPDDENGMTECWNPMDYVRPETRLRTSDILKIANILYPPNPEEVWNATATNLFLGLSLYIMDTPKELKDGNFNIATIKKYATSLPCLKDTDTFNKYVAERASFGTPLHESTIDCLSKFAETTDKLRGSILISFDSPLSCFIDPITAAATRKSTFDFRNVRKQRMTIYVVIKPSSIDRFGGFLNLFFQQLLLENLSVLPQDDPTLKYQCLLLMDEFTAMGRVSIIEKASAYMAGYNMRLLLIFQSKSQVEDKKLYDVTGASTMLTNMALQIIYAPRDQKDAEDYSKMLGDMTEKSVSKSRSAGGGINGKGGGGSDSTSDQRRAVLLPQEIKDIGIAKAIISMENVRPALVDKIFWYKEPVFIERCNLPKAYVPCQLDEDDSEGGSIASATYFTDTYGGKSPALQAMGGGVMFEVGFSPKRNAKEIVLGAIVSAQDELLVAAYSITCKDIAKAIGERHAAGVKVRLLVDKEQNDDKQQGYKATDFLEGLGVRVKRSICYRAMHHKFMVIDGVSVQLGSYNYTSSAHASNAESAFFIRGQPDIASIYRDEFIRLFTEPDISYKVTEEAARKMDALKLIVGVE